MRLLEFELVSSCLASCAFNINWLPVALPVTFLNTTIMFPLCHLYDMLDKPSLFGLSSCGKCFKDDTSSKAQHWTHSTFLWSSLYDGPQIVLQYSVIGCTIILHNRVTLASSLKTKGVLMSPNTLPSSEYFHFSHETLSHCQWWSLDRVQTFFTVFPSILYWHSGFYTDCSSC